MIYFDNAATTFPKPPSVVSEIMNCMTSYCGNPGRSGHNLSLKAAQKIYDCRELLANMFNVSSPTNVIFTPNTTYALNIAINALIRRKSHILISDIEHNSVYRTVCSLSNIGCEYDIFTVDPFDVSKTIKYIKSKIKYNTSVIVCTHVSNICGITNPIYEIGKICKAYGIKFIVDGAQSVGTHKIDMKLNNIDALCAPGHKGLYGPQGTGFVIFSDNYTNEKEISKLNTFVYGGNGYNSSDKYMPNILPERFEGGTLNTPGIAGLYEGIKFVKSLTEEKIFDHTCMLYKKAIEMIKSLPKTTLYCEKIKNSSCLLFNVENMPCDEVADRLNSDGICVRAGLHCTPLGHKKLQTQNGGVRVSFSCFNTFSELDNFYKSLKNICY